MLFGAEKRGPGRDVQKLLRMRSVAMEIKWEVISSQVLEPDLVRVLVGPMVSAAHISARIEKRHFSQRRATPFPFSDL